MRLTRQAGRLVALMIAICFAASSAIGQNTPVAADDISILRPPAEAGDAGAQYHLGETYRTGRGVPQSYELAGKWYRRAADQGNAKAQNKLAVLLSQGLGVLPDPGAAFELFSKAASQGDAEHIKDLALAYENGVGIAANAARAAELYAQAAKAGSQTAAVSLAVLYLEGRGVEKNPARAAELLQSPANAGDAKAQNNLGLLYSRGDGVEQDYTRAADLFKRASAQGLPVAMGNLGVMYENGFGVEQSDEIAAQWYRRRANAGEITAQGYYFDPRLATPDVAAFERYLVSARTGDPVAQYLVGYLLVASASTTQEYRRAAGWFKKAADHGMVGAMANLGVLHMQGRGVLQDFVNGYMWLTLAAAGGAPDLQALRNNMAREMTATQITTANRLAATRWNKARPEE